MKQHIVTSSDKKKIAAMWSNFTPKEIARILDFSDSTIKKQAALLGLKTRYVPVPRFWTADKIAYLKEHYSEETNKDIAKALNTSVSAIVRTAGKLHLKKSHEFFVRMSNSEAAVANRFKKGFIPTNKGVKMSDEAKKSDWYQKMTKTQFKKGNVPHNLKPIGTERTMHDGTIMVKTGEPNKWTNRAVVVWQNAGREVPDGFFLRHKNGNNQDDRIENLFLIDRVEHAIRNSDRNKNVSEEVIELEVLKARINKELKNK